jgi:Ca-activated chloride channel family protein
MLRLLVASCVVCSTVAHAGELPRSIGMYTPQNTQLALVDSKIEVIVRGPIVEATVTQKFVNKTDRPTEATYVFPLPPDAAVSAMTIDSGSKKIHAAIERR